jgi:Domain of unknown function (DUF4331)
MDPRQPSHIGGSVVSTRSRLVALAGASLIAMSSVTGVLASSHREAPLIAGDPAADNTDLYAFVSPDDPSKLTIIANYIPLQQPGGGPNFHPFGDDVRYRIHIDNTGDAKDDVTYTIRFKTMAKSGKNGVSSFLYNGGPITSVSDPDWLVPQQFDIERTKGDTTTKIGDDLLTVPANVGPRSTPNYAALAATGVHTLTNGGKVLAGPRDDAFFVDLGSIFDLGGLRPFNAAHLLPLPAAAGVDGVAGYNTASIVLQVPISEVRRSTSQPVIGVWASADRRQWKSIATDGTVKWSGAWVQVSRLGNPLINEVIIPRHLKDYWNGQAPAEDAQFVKYYEGPELAGLENLLYGAAGGPTGHAGGALQEIDQTGRTDLSLILLKGVPGVNAIGSNPVAADMLRLNTAIAPCTADPVADDMGTCQRMAVLAGDVAGFPNGRRLADDVTDIELRAVAQGYGSFLAGAFGLPNKSPNNVVGDGVDTNADMPFLASFPYIGLPHSGYESVPPLKPALP